MKLVPENEEMTPSQAARSLAERGAAGFARRPVEMLHLAQTFALVAIAEALEAANQKEES